MQEDEDDDGDARMHIHIMSCQVNFCIISRMVEASCCVFRMHAFSYDTQIHVCPFGNAIRVKERRKEVIL